MATRIPLVAVLNNNLTLIDLLATSLKTYGIRAVSASPMNFRRGHEDVAVFLLLHDPTAVVVDVGVPYVSNWDYLCAVRLIPETRDVPMIVTTPDKRALEKAVGPTDAIELTGTAENLAHLRHAITAAHVS